MQIQISEAIAPADGHANVVAALRLRFHCVQGGMKRLLGSHRVSHHPEFTVRFGQRNPLKRIARLGLPIFEDRSNKIPEVDFRAGWLRSNSVKQILKT
jgi:hypothetical protein